MKYKYKTKIYVKFMNKRIKNNLDAVYTKKNLYSPILYTINDNSYYKCALALTISNNSILWVKISNQYPMYPLLFELEFLRF